MECHCRISGSDMLTIRCSSLQILVIWILKKDLEAVNNGFLFSRVHVSGLTAHDGENQVVPGLAESRQTEKRVISKDEAVKYLP